MPELPEVEITRRGIAPSVEGQIISDVVVREHRLRWPVPASLAQIVKGERVERLSRRAKYLLLTMRKGSLILHLGMSGSLRVLPRSAPPSLHDHVDLVFGDRLVRLRDPRRFGSVIWHPGDALQHRLLRDLGAEPLSNEFNGGLIYRASRGRSVAIKQLLMNQKIVVGVGNIYASESLFRATIRPQTHAGKLSKIRCQALADSVVETLQDSLRAGGSSLRDYVQSNGELGCFQLETLVYDRAGEPCRRCATPIKMIRQGQRSTFYCPSCQR